MSYGQESKGPLFTKIGANDVVPFHAKDTTALIEVLNPCTLINVGCLIGANASANNCTLTVTRNIIPGNTVGNVAVTAITLGPYANVTVGKINYANSSNFTPQDLDAGDELKFVMSNGGGTVSWIPWMEVIPRAQVKANNNDFVALTPA